MHHLKSLQKTLRKMHCICSFLNSINVACSVPMDTHSSFPYVADVADWIIVVSAVQLR